MIEIGIHILNDAALITTNANGDLAKKLYAHFQEPPLEWQEAEKAAPSAFFSSLPWRLESRARGLVLGY